MTIRESTLSLSHQYAYSRSVQTRQIGNVPSGQQIANGQSRLAASAERGNATPKNDDVLLLNQESRLNKLAGQRQEGLTPHWQQVKLILETFLGRAVKVSEVSAEDLEAKSTEAATKHSIALSVEAGVENAESQWLQVSFEESEFSKVSIAAVITLENGKVLNLLLEEKMARSLSIDMAMSGADAAKFIDPLVVNFGGPVRLSNERVDFDLNADGEMDAIPTFASASMYLALDRNGDGKINNGSELFGAISGEGFAELAEFDDDKNGVIDNNDAVFSRLVLFDPATSKLKSLSQPQSHLNNSSQPGGIQFSTGIDAIFLQKVDSPFSLTDSQGEVLGRVRSTGLYLSGDSVGSVQQIDLVV